LEGLTVGSLIGGGFSKGFKNVVPLTINFILWILTIWIPYLNVGTTIGLIAIAVAMSKGAMISPVEIFKPMYRKHFGEVFLTSALVYLGTIVAFVFVVIPGVVLSIAWSLSILLVVGKEMNPLEAMNESNKRTYGKKWTIFGGEIVLGLICGVAVGIFGGIGAAIGGGVGIILYIIAAILGLISMSVLTGAQATVYEKLAG
jgi:hypothetical protein